MSDSNLPTTWCTVNRGYPQRCETCGEHCYPHLVAGMGIGFRICCEACCPLCQSPHTETQAVESIPRAGGAIVSFPTNGLLTARRASMQAAGSSLSSFSSEVSDT